MKRLHKVVLILLLGLGEAWGQGSVYSGVVFNRSGQPISGASVAVSTTNPCSPSTLCSNGVSGGLYTGATPPANLATLGTDITLGTQGPNPLTTDSYGNYSAYATPAVYYSTVYGTGITAYVVAFAVPFTVTPGNYVDLISNQSVGGNKTWTGNSIANGTFTFNAGNVFNSTNSFAGTNTYTGANNFNVGGGANLTATNAAGDAGFNQNSATGGLASSASLVAVTSGGSSGEYKFNLGGGTFPFGWLWCTTTGSTYCPLQLAAPDNAQNGLIINNNANDAAVAFNASNAGATVLSTHTFVAKVSNGRVGEFQFQVNNAALDPNAAWEFYATVANTIPFKVNMNAPNGALWVNADGTTQFSSVSFATLGGITPSNGAVIYCSNCKNVVDDSATAGVACLGAGSGALARRQNGRWDCN